MVFLLSVMVFVHYLYKRRYFYETWIMLTTLNERCDGFQRLSD